MNLILLNQFAKKYNLIISISVLLFTYLNSIVIPQTKLSQDKNFIQPKIPFIAKPFDIKDVRILDGEFKRAMDLNYRYLISMDVNRLLHNFKVNAGIQSSAKPLGGWEEPSIELRGHFTGHFLSASALMYSSTGDKVFLEKVDSLLFGLEECQKAINLQGYLSAFPEKFFDRVESGIRVWAPYYTIHKIFAGLIDVYLHMNKQKALQIAEEMAYWVKLRTDKLSEQQIQKMLRVEFGGMNEMFYNLYAITGKEVYMELAKRFEDKFVFEPLSNHEDKLKGLHVNTQIPKIIGAIRAYELTGDEYYKSIAKYFWNQVVEARSYSTGGTSNYEHWRSEPYHLFDQLSSENHENCCTYNMLKLTSHLYSLDPKLEYADYYERALFNGIMGTQHPEVGGAFMYYVPMLPGAWRMYCAPEESYVCCSGTGIESFSKFGDNIYFHNENSLYVNLFISSQVNWKEKNLTLIQKTNFPDEQSTTLKFSVTQPVDLTLNLRVPYWAAKNYQIKINDVLENVSANPSSYVQIKRVWKNNDKVEIIMPFDLHLEKMPDYPNRASIMFGPLVLAGKLGQKQMNEVMKFGIGEDVERLNKETAALPIPKFISDETNLNNWIKPVVGKNLTFRTINTGVPQDIELIPFYKLFGERYAVYFDIYTTTEWQAFQEKLIKKPADVIDKWFVGNKFSNDEHNFQAWISETGEVNGKNWVRSKSWFKFDMGINPSEAIILRALFYGDESDADFYLSVDGIKIPTKRIDKHSNHFYTVDFELPYELTKEKERIGIQFKVSESKNLSNQQSSEDRQTRRFETPKLFECDTRIK
ncbi:MAG: glycoside hydrolase family 127 protein [Ignavibacteriaceae bacterium]|nr:glycoside hydrolase family 127 protein [Ignavibacteriaceae bacterium]